MLPDSHGSAVRGDAGEKAKGGIQSRLEIVMWCVLCELAFCDCAFVYRLERQFGNGQNGLEKAQSTGD